MSITLTRQTTYNCAFADCDETRTESSSVDGSYCSVECAARDTGRQFLRDLRHDHRFCTSCFRQRKEIERPTAAARCGLGVHTDAALVGFEYLTEHAAPGVHGIECACGAVNHDIDEEWLRESGAYHWFLKTAAETLVGEGQREDTLDLATLANTLWETDDLELAVGLALRA